MPRAGSIAIPSGGIINLPASTCKGCAQIDIALCIRRVVTRIRNRESVRDLLMVRGSKVITEEEEFVLDDGTADAGAVVVVRQMAERSGLEVGFGINGAVLDKLEGRTMECV